MKLETLIKAGFAGIYIRSHEESRVEAEMLKVGKACKFRVWAWSCVGGIVSADGEQIPDTANPLKALTAIASEAIPPRSIVLMRDYHMLLKEPNPVLVRKTKEVLEDCRNTQKRVVVCGCQYHLPPELEKEFTLQEFELPDREQLGVVLDNIVAQAKKDGIEITVPDRAKVLDAARGLTSMEASDAFSLSIVENHGKVLAEVVGKVKAETVKKNGLLEVIESTVTLDKIGGLERLKAVLFEERNLFSQEARDYGLPTPRGKLIVGQAGTGKSLCATATGNIFGIPLLQLEASRLFAGIVGGTESNWRAVHATARAIQPCVLWVDEVDGLFEGAASSGHTDGGTTSRVIKTILQDMQYHSEGIFYIFTANDVDKLPDPLIDRLDVWSVDLPTASEREQIVAIHIAKRNRKPSKFNLPAVAAATEGFSGRQIEQVWLTAMARAFNAKREPTTEDFVAVAKETVPTSVTMAEAIRARRQRLQNRARPASEPETKTTGKRKLSC